ncbi:MAG TPA: tetratricopeptide repeat protein [Nostocaceae cyanobacterium]|nr:tetratricopeptide repeat protein [Nostocaceae cyanobacterium]
MLGNKLVGRYEIINLLGGGGFGETYVACDTHLPSSPQCVVKKLQPQSTNAANLAIARRLFDTEAQVLHKLGTHDRIPQLLAYFEENAEFYLVQEFIAGHDLSQELTPGKTLSQAQVIVLLQEILEILDFVHEQKVIHRDVNPRNLIRREQDGKLILIDFGAVKQIATQVVTPTGQTKFTVAIGTPGYIPGEQAQGTPKFSSDIYAVGIIAIQALTGLSPDELEIDADTNEIIWQNRVQVSPEFAQFLNQMVCYDFRQRYASAAVALNALRELNQPPGGTIAVAPAVNINHNQPVKVKKNIFWKLALILLFIGFLGTGSVFLFLYVNANNAIELTKQGNTFLQLQRYEDALAVYEKAVNLKPNYAQGWYGQGKALFALKKYQPALNAYDQAIQIQPDYLEAWTGRGFTLINLQRYQEAIASFDRSLQINSKSPEIWSAKGDAFRSLNQYNQAITAYDQAIDLQLDNYEFWYKKALSWQSLKNYEQAITAFSKVVELKPEYELAWYNLGNALVNLNRYEDAFQAYDKAVQNKPNFSAAWLSRGNVLITLRRYVEANDSFNQVIKNNPDNYQAWYNKGWSLHQMQRYPDAIEAYKKAISLKRNDYLVWYNLGNAEYNLGKYTEAVEAYSKAVRYQPNHYESWYSRGNALGNLQRYQEAIASYEQALKYKSDYQAAQEALNQAKTKLTFQPNSVIVPTIPNN